MRGLKQRLNTQPSRQWDGARNRHSIVFNKPRVCLKYHYPSHCILSFSLPWFTPKVLGVLPSQSGAKVPQGFVAYWWLTGNQDRSFVRLVCHFIPKIWLKWWLSWNVILFAKTVSWWLTIKFIQQAERVNRHREASPIFTDSHERGIYIH